MTSRALFNVLRRTSVAAIPQIRSKSLRFIPTQLQFQGPIRSIHQTSTVLKKGSKGGSKGKKEKEEEIIDDAHSSGIDEGALLKSTEEKFKATIEYFKEKATEIKIGKANPKMFDDIEVPIDHNQTVPFNTIAQTNSRGKALQITVFDTKYVKYVVSAIISLNLNINPQVDPRNPQMLKVPLPGATKESKEQAIKLLKDKYQHVKNSPSKVSFSTARKEALDSSKKLKGGSDAVKKFTKKIEDLHKVFDKKLTEHLKATEKAINDA